MAAEPATDRTERRTRADAAWVVVADGSRARIFETPGLELVLREIEDLVNVAPDGPALSEKEGGKFANPVADRVEQGRLDLRYQGLRFAVEPKFIGMLRERLSEQTRQMIFEDQRRSGGPRRARS
jgi:protein required for attachment to host cells